MVVGVVKLVAEGVAVLAVVDEVPIPSSVWLIWMSCSSWFMDSI